MLARSRRLLRKSVAAMIAAIEVYNKPDFKYREETFAMLAINAWELLFKALLLDRTRNNLRALYVYERRPKADGTKSSKRYIKRNRSGNPITVGIARAQNLIEAGGWHQFNPAVTANLEGLTEIRDNAVHFSNEHLAFSKAVQELGTASVQNYVRLVKVWFDEDLSEYNFYLMPLAFFRSFKGAAAVELSVEEQRVVERIAALHSEHHDADAGEFSVLLEMDVRLKRTSTPTGMRLALGDDPDAIAVTLTEEDIREQYPWNYAELSRRLSRRYSDFKQNQEYHDLRTLLKKDKLYVMERLLDPGNPKSLRKGFYSGNCLNVFDQHYTRRGKGGEQDGA